MGIKYYLSETHSKTMYLRQNKIIRHVRTHKYIMLYEEHQIIMRSKLLQQVRKNKKESDVLVLRSVNNMCFELVYLLCTISSAECHYVSEDCSQL